MVPFQPPDGLGHCHGDTPWPWAQWPQVSLSWATCRSQFCWDSLNLDSTELATALGDHTGDKWLLYGEIWTPPNVSLLVKAQDNSESNRMASIYRTLFMKSFDNGAFHCYLPLKQLVGELRGPVDYLKPDMLHEYINSDLSLWFPLHISEIICFYLWSEILFR